MPSVRANESEHLLVVAVRGPDGAEEIGGVDLISTQEATIATAAASVRPPAVAVIGDVADIDGLANGVIT